MTPLAGPGRKLLGPAFEPVRDFVWSIFSFTERTAVLWIAVYVALAFAVWAVRERRSRANGFLRWLFPREIYAHPSAKADYVYFLVDKVLSLVALGALATSADRVTARLLAICPAAPAPERAWASVLLTVALFLAFDFGGFFWHYLTHRVQVLWAFHRVHHAVEVLTPISNYREHPIDSLGRSLMQGVLVGVMHALVLQVLPSARVLTLWGENALYVPFFVFANARHSHVWIRFGPFWDRIFSSPAQHQIHHGTAPEHVDVNYGLVLALWDRLFGTLHLPREKEDVRYGLIGETRPFPTVTSMYVRPFADAWRRLRLPGRLSLARP